MIDRNKCCARFAVHRLHRLHRIWRHHFKPNIAPNFSLLLALLIVSFVFEARGSLAQPSADVDVELVLLADASNSIDEGEIRFQRQGYARAIEHRDVLSAIAQGDLQRIAVTFIEWGDEDSQDVVVPWTVVANLSDARRFSDRLLAAPRRAFGSNAIGAALLVAQDEIEGNAFRGARRVIDFSGDSANNWSGISIAEARKRVLDAGTIINGLAILCRTDDCGGRPVSYDLEKAFANDIIGGPGSFVITVDSARRFAQAVRHKFILELAGIASQSLSNRVAGCLLGSRYSTLCLD
ncbi:MAG: DUF1194 domain-containing protein [Hyphomicrobiaceae bacterium]